MPLTDANFLRQMESWMVTTRPHRRDPLWVAIDETMRNWLKQTVISQVPGNSIHRPPLIRPDNVYSRLAIDAESVNRPTGMIDGFNGSRQRPLAGDSQQQCHMYHTRKC